MMNCHEFQGSLDLYVDGELSPQLASEATAHLSICTACHKAVNERVYLRHTLKKIVAQHQPPPDLVRHVNRFYMPSWLDSLSSLPTRFALNKANSARQATIDTARAENTTFWCRKIVLPAPIFTGLLMGLIALSVWLIGERKLTFLPTAERAQNEPVPATSALPSSVGFDLSRFDHGQRAAIYKVQRTRERNTGR